MQSSTAVSMHARGSDVIPPTEVKWQLPQTICIFEHRKLAKNLQKVTNAIAHIPTAKVELYIKENNILPGPIQMARPATPSNKNKQVYLFTDERSAFAINGVCESD